MFCSNCGCEIHDNAARFCGKCGAEVARAASPTGYTSPTGSTSPTFNFQMPDSLPFSIDTSNIGKKIVYAVLVLISTILSFGKLVGYVSYGDLVDYVSWVGGSAFLSLGLWCIRLGMVLLLAAVVLVFVKPQYSRYVNITGAILNLASIVILILSMMSLASSLGASASEGLEVFSGTMWFFVIVNIAIMIMSSPGQMYESKFIETYADKKYDHLDGAYKEHLDNWKCQDCGKMNHSSMLYCTCGEARDKFRRRY